MLGFVSFSMIASAVYVLNDIKDVEKDRLHPEKRMRPIASGKVTISTGYVILAICLVLSIALAYFVEIQLLYVVLGYFVMNIFYTFWLKQLPIIDITIIAIGFLLRVVAGGVISDTVLSQWLIIMVFLLALFLGIAKRRDDVLLLEESGKTLRKAVSGYNIVFINGCLYFLSSTILVTYILYTVSPEVMARHSNQYLYLTSIFVILGLMRYLQITLVENNSGSPTKILLRDRFTQLVIAGWIISIYLFLYIF